MHRLWAVRLSLLALTLGFASPAALAAPRNVLLVIADDYGIDVTTYYPLSDRQVTNPPAPTTTNLANLAKAGLLFRNAWAQPSCSPSRATLLTGRYGFRTGIGKQIPQELSSPAPVFRLSEFTLPEAFKARPDLHYDLAHIGKWHLSRGIDDPNLRGWPYFSGPHPDLAHLESYFSWPKVVNGVQMTSTVYATTDQVNEAVAAIGRAKAAGRPYFIWLAFSAPHAPYQKPPNNLHTRDGLPAVGAPKRAYYEAMIEAMDTEIGRLLKAVDLKTTTVIFLGDNGTPNEVTAKPYNPDHAKLRVYEQGVRVPLIIAGAGVGQPGRTVDRIVNSVDLYPTILNLAGIDPAAVVPSGVKLDGVSLMPYIQSGVGGPLRTSIYADKFDLAYNEQVERTIRNAQFKLIERAPALKWPVREFFNIKNDPYEKSNLLQRALSTTEQSNLSILDSALDDLLATR
jgi:arylsulfatase B